MKKFIKSLLCKHNWVKTEESMKLDTKGIYTTRHIKQRWCSKCGIQSQYPHIINKNTKEFWKMHKCDHSNKENIGKIWCVDCEENTSNHYT